MSLAPDLAEEVQRAQQEIANLQVTGEAGGGMAKVTMTGKHQVVRVTLDPSLISGYDKRVLKVAAQLAATLGLNVRASIQKPIKTAELREVLARPKFRRWVSSELAAEFVDGLEEAAMMLEDPPARDRISSDPDDDYLIVLARAGEADFLVSGDSDLTGLADASPPVVTPRAFLERLVETTD